MKMIKTWKYKKSGKDNHNWSDGSVNQFARAEVLKFTISSGKEFSYFFF